ncbi:urease accessory protein UreE [Oharaeibacter diazotrophicus]|uniref:Urease accessory protein n=1 Tax=Oharaeibacter diazotrophicus TaxID=1920512 RepID=A0A4R6R5C5_9HYPH|nr:urease accessory protein UreE [Oharaeibacter diazotrophicus]TDP81131.1 urease accessory protein [Oharaeibacter diazotrophicus]BBE74876.1 urease accessory protein UreE [Pleomorphomonas sp. SM30]GLS75620.1 urease accessory protein UreE 1 [Oharaeibacter diazotrophicus]
MLRLHGIVGDRRDPALADRLHDLAHADAVEYLFVAEADLGRGRLRAVTDRGTDCAVSLERGETLYDGAVLALGADRAVVVRAGAPRLLRLSARDDAAALRLGFMAGHLHWRVRFDGADLVVLLDGPAADYTARISALIDEGAVSVAADDSAEGPDHGHGEDGHEHHHHHHPHPHGPHGHGD